MRGPCTSVGAKRHHGLRCGSRLSHRLLTSNLNAIHFFFRRQVHVREAAVGHVPGSCQMNRFLTFYFFAIHLFRPAGKYMFEKLLSGMFLGEVARRVLLRLAQDPTASLFGRTTTTTTTTAAAAGTSDTAAATATVPVVPAPLTQKGGFTTAHLAAIVDAESASSRAAIVNRVLGVQVPRLGQQAVSSSRGSRYLGRGWYCL